MPARVQLSPQKISASFSGKPEPLDCLGNEAYESDAEQQSSPDDRLVPNHSGRDRAPGICRDRKNRVQIPKRASSPTAHPRTPFQSTSFAG